MAQNYEKVVPSLVSLDVNDEEKRDNYVREMEDALRKYIKTGVKTKQMDEIIETENLFQRRSKEIFDMDKITENILQQIVDATQIKEKEYNSTCDIMEISYSSKENNFISEFKENMILSMQEVIENVFSEVMKDVVYLSHMNMIYEIYEKEEQLRKEEEEYEKISEEYQKMADISKKLSEKKRMEAEMLQKSVDLSKDELIKILYDNQKLFNIRNKKETLQVSLSPAGRKFHSFIENKEEKYPKEALNYLVYKNCSSIMEAVEKSYEGKLEIQWRADHISASAERSIQQKYHKLAKKLSKKNDDVYMIWQDIESMEMERKMNREKDKYRAIQNEWDRNFNGIV